MITMKIGPFPFWVISPFAGAQLWTYYCVLNASSLPAIAVELSSVLSSPGGHAWSAPKLT